MQVWLFQERSQPEDQLQSWKTTQPPFYSKKVKERQKQQMMKESSSQVASEMERGMVSDYETKLSRKKEEVLQLLKEREELKATHKRLLNLQKKMKIGPVSCIKKWIPPNSWFVYSNVYHFNNDISDYLILLCVNCYALYLQLIFGTLLFYLAHASSFLPVYNNWATAAQV